MLNITNGNIAWFDCHIHDDRMMFSARVNIATSKVTSERGTIALADDMRCLTPDEAHAIMVPTLAKSQQSVKSLASLFGFKPHDMAEVLYWLRHHRIVPGCTIDATTLTTRSGTKVRIR